MAIALNKPHKQEYYKFSYTASTRREVILVEAAAAGGLMPLEHLLDVVRDPNDPTIVG